MSFFYSVTCRKSNVHMSKPSFKAVLLGVFVYVYSHTCTHTFYYLEHFLVPSKTGQKVQRFPIHPLCPHVHSPPIVNTPNQSGAFVTTDKPTLTSFISQTP